VPTLARVETLTPTVAARPRDYVRVAGADAAAFLQRMVSNDVEALAEGGSCDAMLLTAKGRVVAVMRVWRRAADDFLLLTEPGLGDIVCRTLVRMRIASKCEIEQEQHASTLVFADDVDGIANEDYGVPAVEVLDADVAGRPLEPHELERLRILAGTPRVGVDVDESVFPAEAGLDERAVSWTKGCYPGQEFVARLRYRGHANRRLRVLEVEGRARRDGEICTGGKVVGRVTSSVDGLALGYVRSEVADDAPLEIDGVAARLRS
jgi:folate-binding protein YgfZ